MVIILLGYYILIKGVSKLTNIEKETLLELLEEILIMPKIEINEDVLTVIEYNRADISWKEFIITINSDFYADLRLYESVLFISKTKLLESLLKNKDKDLFIQTYNNDKLLFYQGVYQNINEDFKKTVLKSLYYDKEFLKSIKIYLEENKNTSKASLKANLHRNTLENRLEKFYKLTGYDLKNFSDSVFIYLLIKDIH